MLLNVSIYSWDDKWKSMTDEQYRDLAEAIPMLDPEKKPEYPGTVVVDDDGLRAMAKYGLQITLDEEGQKGCMFVKLQDKLEALGLKCADLSQAVAANAAVQIAIPDLGLMTIQTVEVLENCCTDVLQGHLDKGWRILAVCPPNAQRRPDYVLGRKDKAE